MFPLKHNFRRALAGAIFLLTASAFGVESLTPVEIIADTASRTEIKTPWIGAYTVFGWVYLTDSKASTRFLNAYDANGTEVLRFDIAQGQPRFEHKFGDRWQVARPTDALPLNCWVHLAAQIDAEGSLRLFINGQQVALRDIRSIPIQPLQKLEIIPEKFPGKLGTFYLSAGALSSPSLEKLFNAGDHGTVNPADITLRTFEEPARSIHPDYAALALRLASDTIVPFDGGLIAKASVLPPTHPGARPDIITQSRAIGASRVFLPNNEKYPEKMQGRYQMGARVSLPRLTFGGVPFHGVLTPIKRPDGTYVMAAVVKSPLTGLSELFLFAVPKNEDTQLQPLGTIPCGGKRIPYQLAYSGKQLQFLGDVEGDGTPDLLMSAGRSVASYYPDDPKNFWAGTELPNSGRGKGYTINGKWLGGDGIITFYWAKGSWDDQGNLRFNDARNIYSVEKDFKLQWRGDFGARAAALSIAGKPHIVIAGDLDRFMAMPVEMQGNDIRCGEAVNLLADNALLEENYIMEQLSVADMNGDGNIDIQGLFDALPADLPISVEVVNFEREKSANPAEWAATCLAASRPFVER